ncbi:MAG TPA: hypothetical protein VFO10_19545 [Oligoflexus sp.]|uniref:hypothetical protein n=1 Tax=Oligoflexus sp. TaxID=1971216 RepID=UPI002D7EAEBB|nr:hypothetical protein [Oligoflexus sp.]HET9239466.1 hypothetical protein [Oligoflexus sp.]
MKALLILALCSSVALAQKNPDLLAKFEKLVKESEGLQIPPVTDANLSKLYFLDKQIRDICPESDPKEPCVHYISQNSQRFSAGEVARVAVTTYWLTKQKVRDKVAYGDAELEDLILFVNNEQEGFGASIEVLQNLEKDVEDWFKKYKRHPRTPEPVQLKKSLAKEINWKKTNRNPNAIYQP